MIFEFGKRKFLIAQITSRKIITCGILSQRNDYIKSNIGKYFKSLWHRILGELSFSERFRLLLRYLVGPLDKNLIEIDADYCQET